ncbi:MAG: FAD-dependent oxidoreductase [Myxococcota bacterium]
MAGLASGAVSDVASGVDKKHRIVVIGGGMAAQQLIENLVARRESVFLSLTLLCEELSPPYDRVHLGRLIETDADGQEGGLGFRDSDWYRDQGIQLRLKDRVEGIDLEAKVVRTESGASVEFDELVIATGGMPFVPPIEGSRLEGVMTYRTLEDAAQISRAARGASHMVIAGGGLLGLEAARAVQKLGCEVDVIEMAPRLLPRQLDVEGAAVLESRIRGLGIGLRVLTRLVRIDRAGPRLRLELSDGNSLETDRLIFAAGIRPRDDLARASGIECHRSGGLIVDDGLETSHPGVFAIGECARHNEIAYGFVAPCYAMADVLADRICGGDRIFEGASPSARLKIDEVDVASVGESLADGRLVRDLTWLAEDQYRRIVIRDGAIVGAIAVGSGSEFPRLQEAVANAARLKPSQERRFARTGHLWKKGTEKPISEWPGEAIVCTCTGVTCGTLRTAWASGCHSSLALTESTSAGSVCGNCKPLLAELAGEVAASRRQGAGAGLGGIAACALGLVAFTVLADPIAMSTSIAEGDSIDFLWRDGWWKQASGFALLGLSVLSLALPLRKKVPALARTSFSRWRLVHTALGLGTMLAAGVHSGLRLGANLNFWLMATFLGLIALGAMSGLVSSLEHRLSHKTGSALRMGWTRAHVLLFWPLPVLVLFHVLAVYLY